MYSVPTQHFLRHYSLKLYYDLWIRVITMGRQGVMSREKSHVVHPLPHALKLCVLCSKRNGMSPMSSRAFKSDD